MPVPTGDTLSSGFVAVTFLLPPDNWWTEALVGGIMPLGQPNQWVGQGDILPAQAAAVFRYTFEHVRVGPTMVGQVVCFAADNMQFIDQNPTHGPSQWRKCEGQSLLKTDFPDLFAVIGSVFGGDATHFNLPDLRGRLIMDAGQGAGLSPRSLADQLGEETHALSSAEVPNHTHTYVAAATTAITIGPGAPAPSAIPAPSVTGASGGGGTHNNIQPSLVLIYYIQVIP